MKAPGEQARLYYDGRVPVEEGDYIRTGTGRLYMVLSNRIQSAGKHAGRQHMLTVVMDPAHEPEPDALVHEIHWYSRNRRG